jgi:hypothetical protein
MDRRLRERNGHCRHVTQEHLPFACGTNARGITMKARQLGEILTHQKTLTKAADKVAWLQGHYSTGLGYLLKLAHSDVEWEMPPGAPPFKQDVGPIGLTPSHLLRELRILYLFIKGGSPVLPRRREQLFQQLLERLHVDEVAIVLALKDGKFPSTYRCTKAVVNEAFPGLLEQSFDLRYFR